MAETIFLPSGLEHIFLVTTNLKRHRYLFTYGHLMAPYGLIGQTVTQTFSAGGVNTPLMGGVMGPDVDIKQTV